MTEWLKADIFLTFFFTGLLVSGYILDIKNKKKVAMGFYIASVIVIVFVLGNILYFNLVKTIST